ncbi:Cytochrome P450 734A1 [Rhynchospora pubera]|uniref:Cytochrome P450 734A1 n=1 Tax=Rhynchospora pubera TaxID=906938 RepID=A0AAV8D528_9POAL|nr:Cytochrome P450 734A1 [Rhynchospora pubera]
MEESCDAIVPYTLLGFLLRRLSDPDPFPPCLSGDLQTSYFLRGYLTRGTNAILWILLFSVTFVLLNRLGRIVRLWALGGRIPGPPVWALLGGSSTAPQLCGSDRDVDLTSFLSKLHENYGPLVKLWFGPSQLFVSVKDTQLIKEILIKAKDKLPLTERAYNLAFGALSLFVSAFNDKVSENRESLAEYLNNKSISANVLKNLVERTDSLDSVSFAQCMAFKTIGTTLFGDTYLNWNNRTQYEELLMAVAKDGFFWASYVIIPFWRRDYWRYQSVCQRLKGLTLEIMELSEGKSKSVLEASCGDLLALMLHGCVTTARLIANILSRLVLSPNLQEQIYLEVSAIHKGSCVISTDEVKKMQFLLATVLESVRLLPAGPFLQRCSLKSDMRLENGIMIPAGATVVVPLHLVQMDASVCGGDFLEFIPNRFLSNENNHDEDKELTCTKHHCINESIKFEALLSFGDGARACVGQSFAVLSIATLLASIIYDFEIKLEQNAAEDPSQGVHDFISQEISSPRIVLSKRNGAN